LGPWDGPQRRQSDLAEFEDFTDDEIEIIRDILDTHPMTLDEVVAAGQQVLFRSSSSSDDDDATWIPADEDGNLLEIPQPTPTSNLLKPPIDVFNLESLEQEVQSTFAEIYSTETFQAAQSFREQIFLAVTYMRGDGRRIPYSQIGIIFGISKGAVTSHCHRMLTDRKVAGRPVSIDEENWNHLRGFILERFSAGNPPTTNDLLEFLATRCGVPLAPPTLPGLIRLDPELRRIQ
jgi:hypothetical protein